MKTTKVFQSETNEYVDMQLIGIVKYIGDSFFSFENGSDYSVVGVEGNLLRVVDASGEDYLYPASNPRPLEINVSKGGKWEIVEDFTGEIANIIN